MKWTWPWTREPAPPLPVVDVEAIASAAANRAAEIVLLKSVDRAMIADSPMPGPPNPGSTSKYGAYHWDNPLWFATPQAPTRRPGSQIDTRTLRTIADTYDILRACIQHLKREVGAVPLQIVPKDDKDQGGQAKAQVAEAQAFLTARGGLGGPGMLRSEFEGQVIEDVSVVGAAALHYHPTFGGGVYEVIPLDAATIRPRVDAWGWPGPGEEVFEQWVMGTKITGFTRETLSYRGLATNSRSYSPYYWSPVEWLIYVIESALKADDWNRKWLTDGNTPADMVSLPETWTPGQVKEFAEWWDTLMSGNTSQRVKTKFVPGGTKTVSQSRKDQEFQEFEMWLLKRTCSIMGVQATSIGYVGEQYKHTQEDSMESTSEFGAGVLLDYREVQYNDIWERMGLDLIKTVNVTSREEDAAERAERNSKLVGGVSIITVNEARQEEGKDPIDGGDTLFVPTTMQPIDIALNPPEPAPVAVGSGGQPAQKRALLQWRDKALNRLRGGSPAVCDFTSDAIPKELNFAIIARLGQCQTAEDVKVVFASIQEDTP